MSAPIDVQWSRSAQSIVGWMLGACILAQLVVMGFFYGFWIAIAGIAFGLLEGVCVAIEGRRRRDPEILGLLAVLWVAGVLHPRIAYGITVVVMLLVLRFSPRWARRPCAAAIAVGFVVLAIVQPTSLYGILGPGPAWGPAAYQVCCGAAALPFVLFAVSKAAPPKAPIVSAPRGD